jgi:hypothetical protein
MDLSYFFKYIVATVGSLLEDKDGRNVNLNSLRQRLSLDKTLSQNLDAYAPPYSASKV